MIKYYKTWTPNKRKVLSLIGNSIENGVLTNNGPLVNSLEEKLSQYLGVKNVVCVTNGTIAIQLALKALGVKGRVISTPFTYIATSSAIKWEGLNIEYADIDNKTFNIDVKNIKNVAKDVSCIIPVHTFGNPCDLDAINEFVLKNKINIIYDAAHAFGVCHNGISVLKYGDISTLSFHATKVFHTVEGGAVITENDDLAEYIRSIRSFGMYGNTFGINAKMTEVNAAFGLVNLENIDIILERRKKIYSLYDNNIDISLERQALVDNTTKNYSYYPILLNNNIERDKLFNDLLLHGVETRKYFSPSLDNLFSKEKFSISNNISNRILCLPIYPTLKKKETDLICKLVNKLTK